MTTFAQRRSPSSRTERVCLEPKRREYDSRAVDQFYSYCQAVDRTNRHRDEAHNRSHNAAKRSIWAMLVAGSLLSYYVIDRVAQAMSLF